jgi:hypothetical protein
MVDLSKIREYEENIKKEEDENFNRFKELVEPALPIAILFCNENGQDNADKDQLKLIFEGSDSFKFQALEGGPEGLELVSYLAQFISSKTGKDVNDVLVIFNANEQGFDVIRLMNYFDEKYYVQSLKEALVLEKLGFYLEEKSYFEMYAEQLRDKASEIYNHFHDELSARIYKPSAMSNEIDLLYDMSVSSDKLSEAIKRLVDEVKHV